MERDGNTLRIYRYLKPGKIDIMTSKAAKYMNRIDMGIYLAILELCLKHERIHYTLELHPDSGTEAEKTLAATISIHS